MLTPLWRFSRVHLLRLGWSLLTSVCGTNYSGHFKQGWNVIGLYSTHSFAFTHIELFKRYRRR